MEKRNLDERSEPEIVYSRSMKAGKRIYYLDVKKARNEDLYLCITESKRRQTAEEEPPQFEKHKLFLYKEDFSRFLTELNDVVEYVKGQVGEISDREEQRPENIEFSEETITDDQPDEPQEEETKRRGFFGLGRRK